MKIYYVLGFSTYVVSYIIFYFLYGKLGIEKLINGKTSRRISLFFIAILFGSVGSLITDSITTTKGYRILINGLFVGPSTALIVFVLPVNNSKSKT